MPRPWFIGAIVALALGLAVTAGHAQRLGRDLAVRTAERDAARTAVTVSEKARTRDAAAAVASYDSLQTTCAAGLAAAVTRGRTIERVTTAPARPGGLRGIIGARELRDVVGEASPASDARPK
jgi:hypothetical protein